MRMGDIFLLKNKKMGGDFCYELGRYVGLVQICNGINVEDKGVINKLLITPFFYYIITPRGKENE